MDSLDRETVEAAARATDRRYVYPDDPDLVHEDGLVWDEQDGAVLFVPNEQEEDGFIEVQLYVPGQGKDNWELVAFGIPNDMARSYWRLVTGSEPKDFIEEAIGARTIVLSTLHEKIDGGANPGYYEMYDVVEVHRPFLPGTHVPRYGG